MGPRPWFTLRPFHVRSQELGPFMSAPSLVTEKNTEALPRYKCSEGGKSQCRQIMHARSILKASTCTCWLSEKAFLRKLCVCVRVCARANVRARTHKATHTPIHSCIVMFTVMLPRLIHRHPSTLIHKSLTSLNDFLPESVEPG